MVSYFFRVIFRCLIDCLALFLTRLTPPFSLPYRLSCSLSNEADPSFYRPRRECLQIASPKRECNSKRRFPPLLKTCCMLMSFPVWVSIVSLRLTGEDLIRAGEGSPGHHHYWFLSASPTPTLCFRSLSAVFLDAGLGPIGHEWDSSLGPIDHKLEED